MLLSQRKVTFCTACITSVTSSSSVDCAKALLLKNNTISHSSFESSSGSVEHSSSGMK
ncbi:hypothetical protein PF008_g23697 [Phytophthora fragariae]|nr:hypothetical protein PF008_g23697 [Phytophthora fragariae]